jgi:hypothetical protein
MMATLPNSRKLNGDCGETQITEFDNHHEIQSIHRRRIGVAHAHPPQMEWLK